MTKWKIYNEDAVEWAKNYQKGKFHALLCDAPYHLTSVVKRFGKAKLSDNTRTSERVRNREDGYSRLVATGFMGSTWDGGDIAFRPETWAAFGEVLYPGAFGMAFSASRNWHRMAVAIEDAGFIIHPTMFFLWIQGQGFPKATRIDTQIQPKAEQKTVGKSNRHNSKEFGKGGGNPVYNTHPGGVPDLTMPTDEVAARWVGHRYGLQALKPSVEPIIVFQKPYERKPIDNIVSTGAGALNIDAARIPTSENVIINRFTDGAKPWGNGAGHEYDTESTQQGRWPSNLILDENIQGLEQARFFYQVSTQLDEADPFLYQSKVSPKERNAGLDEMPVTIGGSLDGGNDTRNGKNKPQLHPTKNNHPTLKPINLAKYLATLLLPPAEYAPRRIVIPFSGSGSEMIGAGLAGWEHVVGVEFDTENNYVEIAKKRLEHWLP